MLLTSCLCELIHCLNSGEIAHDLPQKIMMEPPVVLVESPLITLAARQRGPLSKQAARAAITWAIDSPWGVATTQATRLDQWTKVDIEVAEQALARASARPREPVSFRGDEGVKIHISSGPRRSGISAAVGAEVLSDAQAANVLIDWLRLLDTPQFGWASADPDPGTWYHEELLPVAPPLFGMFIRWLHALPAGWERAMDPTVVRNLDGCELTELDDGIALLRVFDDPLNHAAPSVREHRRKVSEAIRLAAPG